jgi:hypothetical protein
VEYSWLLHDLLEAPNEGVDGLAGLGDDLGATERSRRRKKPYMNPLAKRLRAQRRSITPSGPSGVRTEPCL